MLRYRKRRRGIRGISRLYIDAQGIGATIKNVEGKPSM
jgi:hypothetical protein